MRLLVVALRPLAGVLLLVREDMLHLLLMVLELRVSRIMVVDSKTVRSTCR